MDIESCQSIHNTSIVVVHSLDVIQSSHWVWILRRHLHMHKTMAGMVARWTNLFKENRKFFVVSQVVQTVQQEGFAPGHRQGEHEPEARKSLVIQHRKGGCEQDQPRAPSSDTVLFFYCCFDGSVVVSNSKEFSNAGPEGSVVDGGLIFIKCPPCTSQM